MLDGCGVGFGDGFIDRGIHFRDAGARGEIGLENREFFRLFFGQFRSIAFRELLDGFFALFHEHLQNLDGFAFVQGANFFNFAMLDGGFHTAQHAEL